MIEALLPSRLATPGPRICRDWIAKGGQHPTHQTRSKPTTAVIKPTPTTRQPSRLHRRCDRCARDRPRADGAIDFASGFRLLGRRLILPGRPAITAFDDPRPTSDHHPSSITHPQRGQKKTESTERRGPLLPHHHDPRSGGAASHPRIAPPRRRQQQQRRPLILPPCKQTTPYCRPEYLRRPQQSRATAPPPDPGGRERAHSLLAPGIADSSSRTFHPAWDPSPSWHPQPAPSPPRHPPCPQRSSAPSPRVSRPTASPCPAHHHRRPCRPSALLPRPPPARPPTLPLRTWLRRRPSVRQAARVGTRQGPY